MNRYKKTSKRLSLPHHLPSFTYAIYNRQALDFLRQIRPYLKSYKTKRADLVLNNYISVTPRNGKYNERLRQARDEFESEFFKIKMS